MATGDDATWSARLDEVLRRHRIPGAVLGLLHRGIRVEAAAGHLSVERRTHVRPDAVFQLGSVSKVYTALLVMQLVDEGALDLDDPLAAVLPDLQLADSDATTAITVRHLLSHASGIDGDHIFDTGPGDDALERLIAACRSVRTIASPGAVMSYCNLGFSMAGRVVGRLTGGTWEQALCDRLTHPAGLTRTAVLPEDLLRFDVAYGHVSGPGGGPTPAPAWTPPRSLGPAGYVCASIGDVLDFATLAPGSVLSASAAEAMRTPQIDVAEPWLMGAQWGLGWALQSWGGHRAIGHFGDGIGHCAYLWIVPDVGFTFALMTNAKSSRPAFLEILGAALAELAPELAPPVPPEPIAGEAVAPAAATFSREGMTHALYTDGAQVRLASTPGGAMARWFGGEPSDIPLLPADRKGRVFVDGAGADRTAVVRFTGPDGTEYLHRGMRAAPRVS
jgi:CubicO group peptidase (beta-lactamase class C family)